MAGEMGYYQPQNYNYGGGGTTQNMVGMGANLLGNAIFPGLGFLTGPIGKFVTQMIQTSGGMEDAAGGGQPGMGGVPSPATGGFFARGPAIHFSQGGIPAPGGWGGVFGQGSTGDVGVSGIMPFWSKIALRAMNQGNPAMGLDQNNAITQYANSLKVSQGAFPSFQALQPYLQKNTGLIGGSGVDFGPMGKQKSAV